MAFSAAELDSLIVDLTSQYERLSREYSEIADENQKEDLADRICSIDYQLARLEEEWQALRCARAMRAGA